MKILALDLGDVWVGSALSDPLGISCKPYKTAKFDNLEEFLDEVLAAEPITTVVVGKPTTVSTGGESEQTKKIIAQKEALEQKYAEVKGRDIKWVLWDERFTSKWADKLQKGIPTKEEKQRAHSVAASFILQNYLDHLAFQRMD